MSTSVDVLAVIDRESSIAYAYRKETGAHILAEEAADDARAAHSAVAELIEAVESYAEAEAALANRELAGINAEPHEKLQRRVHSAREELDAALARVRGVK